MRFQSSLPLSLLCMMLMGLLSSLQGQQLSPQVIGSAGAQAAQGGIQLSYTVGEVIVTSVSADTILLTQGYHQTFPSGSVSLQTPVIGLTAKIFPNPFQDGFYIQPHTDGQQLNLVRVELYNALGQLVWSDSRSLEDQVSSMVQPGSIPEGAYTLLFYSEGKPLFAPTQLLKLSTQH